MSKKTNHLPDAIDDKRSKVNLLIYGISLSLGFTSCILGFLGGGFGMALVAFVLVTIASAVILIPLVLSIMVPFKYWGAFMRSFDSNHNTFEILQELRRHSELLDKVSGDDGSK